jgi:hypothetical protein
MLFMGPSQMSWILGVTQGDTDADTRKCVGLLSLEFWIPVLSSTYCGHQLVDPQVSYTKVDEAITKVDTCQLPIPHQHCWNGMAG